MSRREVVASSTVIGWLAKALAPPPPGAAVALPPRPLMTPAYTRTPKSTAPTTTTMIHLRMSALREIRRVYCVVVGLRVASTTPTRCRDVSCTRSKSTSDFW